MAALKKAMSFLEVIVILASEFLEIYGSAGGSETNGSVTAEAQRGISYHDATGFFKRLLPFVPIVYSKKCASPQ